MKVLSDLQPQADNQIRGVSLETITSEQEFDFVASGLVWTGDSIGSTRAASMTAGVVYLSGRRWSVSAVTSRTFTASKDTYIDINSSGTVVYTEVANNAASPSLSAGSIRIGIIVTGTTTIAATGSINQGQTDRVLPIASSIPYTVTDSLGNLICSRDPSRRLLGYRQITSNFTTTNASATQVTGLTVPIIAPNTTRKLKITAWSGINYNGTANGITYMTVWDGTVGSGTQLARTTHNAPGVANDGSPGIAISIVTPSATSKTYNVGLHALTSGNTAGMEALSTSPAFIKVEME